MNQPSAPLSEDPVAATPVEKGELKPLVTIITTIYNQENYIADVVSSLNAQTSDSWECILVDDGSIDRSYQTALSMVGNDPRFKVITKENGGISSARNLGTVLASPHSQYFVFLDGDDMLATEFVAQLSGYLNNHPNVGLVTCAFVELDKNGVPVRPGIRTRYAPNALGFPRQLKPHEAETPFVTYFCATGQGPFAMMRRSAFEATPGYDERLCPHEDTDIFCQIALISTTHHFPAPLYLKRCHEESIMNSKTEDAEKKFGFFRRNAYSIFRQKWDNYEAKTPEQQAILSKAKRYYYSRHKPFRDFKVALKTLRLIFRDPTKARFDWLFFLCRSGISGLFLGGENRVKR